MVTILNLRVVCAHIQDQKTLFDKIEKKFLLEAELEQSDFTTNPVYITASVTCGQRLPTFVFGFEIVRMWT